MATTTQVPGVYPVALNGRPYLASFEEGAFAEQTIPLQKAQQDTSGLPGEQSLNPDDLWRRSFESWHRGSGQEYFDWEEGDKFRFRSSLGVDPWTEKRLSLLNETEVKLASTASTVKLVVAGSYLYCADGQTLKFTQDILASGAATWTTVGSTPAAAITGLASDGNTVYISFGGQGIYTSPAGDADVSLFSSQPTSVLDFVKGRIMSTYQTSITNVTESSPATVSFMGDGSGFTSTAADSSLTLSLPAESVPGDVILLSLTWTSAANLLPAPDGWTLVDRTTAADTPGVAPQANSAVYWKRYASSDGASVTFSFDAGVDLAAGVTLAYRDAYSTNPIDVTAVTAHTAPSTSIVSPSVTTTQKNTTIISFFNAFTAAGTLGTTTYPATMTSRVGVGGGGGGLFIGSFAADKQAASAGATATDTWTTGFDIDDAVTLTVAIITSHADPLLTHGNSAFTWVGFAEGQGDIYAAGYAGDKSLIYRTQIRADGTALDAPVVAGSLPDGEIVRGIYGYLGILFIGTDRGLRMAVSDANGDLTIGARIDTPSPVRCFEGQDNFVWFGLEDFDISRWGSGTYDGLGRLDLTEQPDTLVSAWASDLMAAASTSTTESVQSIVTFQDRRLFSIGSSDALSRGVYGEKGIKVATGYLDSGLITYGLADTKVATYLDLRHKALVGTLQAYVSTDEGAFVSAGTSTTATSTRPATDPMSTGLPSRGDTHELRIRLNRVNASDTIGPTVTRMTLRAEPAPSRGRLYKVRLILEEFLEVNGADTPCDVLAERAAIRALFDSQTLVDFQEGGRTEQVFIKDFSFESTKMNMNGTTVSGNLDLLLKVPGS